jgi:hypothetical protein
MIQGRGFSELGFGLIASGGQGSAGSLEETWTVVGSHRRRGISDRVRVLLTA